jgi:hypothetical protein
MICAFQEAGHRSEKPALPSRPTHRRSPCSGRSRFVRAPDPFWATQLPTPCGDPTEATCFFTISFSTFSGGDDQHLSLAFGLPSWRSVRVLPVLPSISGGIIEAAPSSPSSPSSPSCLPDLELLQSFRSCGRRPRRPRYARSLDGDRHEPRRAAAV